ncbi:MAG TPA: zf-HC2 domain-containing protein [Gemmatimonadales bacterium]
MTQLDRTNCEEAFRRLDEFLDRRLTPEEMRIIEEHLEVCAWCTREFAFEASVLHGVTRKLRQLEAPPDLVSRILSQLPPAPEGQG